MKTAESFFLCQKSIITLICFKICLILYRKTNTTAYGINRRKAH